MVKSLKNCILLALVIILFIFATRILVRFVHKCNWEWIVRKCDLLLWYMMTRLFIWPQCVYSLHVLVLLFKSLWRPWEGPQRSRDCLQRGSSERKEGVECWPSCGKPAWGSPETLPCGILSRELKKLGSHRVLVTRTRKPCWVTHGAHTSLVHV